MHQYKWMLERKRHLEEKIRDECDYAIRKERERRDAADRERQSQLFAEVDAWRKAGEVRSYVRAVREFRKNLDPQKRRILEQWAAWALGEADKLDPLKSV